MSSGRRLITLLLLASAPFASAGAFVAPALLADTGEHRHSMSLALDEGELHIVLHHDGHDTNGGGATIEAADHDVRFSDGAAFVPAVRFQTRSAPYVLVRVVAAPDAVASCCSNPLISSAETPPPVPPAASAVLRI
jgi:hypothetical protein